MKNGPATSPIGDLVGGKYRIVRLIARGGMGVVYEAQHTVVRRRFAIKFLRRDLAERRDILTRFQREAEAAGALENENVTASVDFGISDDGTPYIVMEYLVGESVASLLAREGRLPVQRAADLVSQACRGVEAAHAAGIVHRDLKPQNLFVSRREDGTDLVKVLDFGVAKLQAIDEATAATGTGVLLGTAAYMSPEQARGEKMVDRRADVYALGTILYELVSQRKPHPGDSQNAILHHIATHPAVPLDTVQPDLPVELGDAIARALASDPTARPQSAEALAQSIAPFARREVWPAAPAQEFSSRPGERTSTLLAPGDSGGGTVAESGPRARPVPRRRARARIAMGAGLALIAIALAVGPLRRAATPPQTGPPALQLGSAGLPPVRPGVGESSASPALPTAGAPNTAARSKATAGRVAEPSVASAGSSPLSARPSADSAEAGPNRHLRSVNPSTSTLARATSPPPALVGHPGGHLGGHLGGRPGGRPESTVERPNRPRDSPQDPVPTSASVAPTDVPLRREERHPASPTFDPENPYK
jgi:eukaryotic-like serine/threonine-protein kinase